MGAGAALAGRTGLMEMEAAKKAVAERERRAQEIFKPTEEWGPTKLLELLGGSVPYMLAPVAAAGAVATLPVTGTAAAALGLGAAGLASAAQFTGTNLQSQLETGKQLEETNLVKAALASLPMAALDTLSLRLLPGVGRLLGDAGIKVTKETAKEVSEQILKKAALDYTKATGRAMGAEGLTETAQQVFERLQAGLSIRDPEARKEYVESFIGGALLGGTLAPAGRYMERSRAEREIGKLDAEAAAQQRAAEEERKKSPEYLQQTAQEYQNLQAQREALTAQIKRGTKEAPLSQSDKDANDVLIRQVKALDRPLAEARAAFLQAGGPDALKALKARELMPSEKGVMDAEAQQVRLEEAASVAEGRGDTERAAALRQQLAALQQEQAPEAPEAQRARLTREIDGLARVLEQRREAMQAAQTPEEALAIAQRAQQADKALKDAQAALAKLPAVPEMTALQRREKTLTKQYQDALQAGDQERVLSLAPKLVEVRQQIESVRPDTGLFAPEMVAAEEQRRADLIEEMATGRERAGAERQQLDTEQQVAREQAARSAALREQLEAEGTAEREAMSELASSRAADMRVRGLEPLKGAQQLALFPESREDVTRSKEGPAISGEQMRLREQIAELEARKEREQNPQRAAQIENQLVPLRDQLADLEFQTVDTARTAAPPETPTPAIGPQGTQAQRLNTLAERVLSMRNVDEDTKELVRQVQDNLPLLLQREAPISVAGARREQMRAAQKQGETVGAWLYRTLQGTAPPELTQRIRDRLAELEAGRRSETERTPTGEIRRGVQAEIEMPATDRKGRPQPQKGTLFEDFQAFTDYLASEGLQAYRLSIGQIFPTLASVQKKLAPLQERVAELRKQFDAVAAQREAVLKADAAERASAEALLRETRAALQRQVNELDAWVQSAGKTLRGEDLIAAERAARQRVEEAAAKAAELRGQFEQATQILTDTQRLVEAETQLVTLDSAGNVVSAPAEREPRVFKGRGPSLPRGERQVSQPTGVLQVYAGQLPSYEALRKAQAELRKRADALAAADKALEQVVKQGIGQDWSDGSSTLRAYLAAKKRKDTAQKEFEFAYRAFGTASKNIPTQEAINDKYIQAYKNKALLDAQLAKAVRALSAARGRLQDMTTRLNAYYTAAQNTGDVRFGENLQRLRNDLLAAEGISAETAQRSQARRAEAEGLAQQARGIATPMRTLQQQTERELRAARERAEQRRAVPAGETQAEREARDAQQRREEQARLERGEAAGEIIRFEKDNDVSLADNEYVRLVERAYDTSLDADARMQAANEADAYLAAKISKQNAQAGRKQQLVETHTTYLKATQEKLGRAREALEAVKLSVRDKKAAKTPEAQAAKLEEKRAKLKQKIEALEALEARHKQNLLRASTIGRVIRTTRKEIQAYREALNRDVARTRVPGERLGEAEGTQRRATGPVTTPEILLPPSLRTGSPESREGTNVTRAKRRLQESRTPTPRDIPMRKEEMAEAQAEAAQMTTLAGVENAEAALAKQFKEAQERGFRPGERDRLTERQAILTARKNALRDPRTGKPLAKKAEEAAPAETEVEAEVEAEAEEAPAPRKPAKKREAAKKAGERVTPADELDEELDAFEPEILGGPSEETFFSEKRTEYDARDLTDLKPETLDAVEDGDIRTTLETLSKNGSTDFVRTVASRLQGLLVRAKMSVSDSVEHEGKQVEGLYNPADNSVKLNRSALSEEVVLHELTHAATMRALEADPQTLTPEQRKARQELEKLHASLQKNDAFAREYGRKDIKEFVSELMSNQAFRDKLDTKTPGLLKRLYNVFLRLIGMPPLTVSKQASDNAYKLFMPSKPLKAAAAPSVFRAATRDFPAGLQEAGALSRQIVGREPGAVDKIRASLLGARQMLIDKLSPVEEAVANSKMESLKAMQLMYYLRMYDQRMNTLSQAISTGAPAIVEKTRPDGRVERLLEAQEGANIKGIVNILSRKDVVKAANGADNANALFTTYLAALRAERVGVDKLDLGKNVTQKDLDTARAQVDNDPVLSKAFREARDLYNQYNRNLLDFVVQTGALSREDANALLADNDYIPYYRIRNGQVDMLVGGQYPIRVGNLKDSPHLRELVGGEAKIMDFMTSSVQNTAMLLDMGMRNLAMRNMAFEFADSGIAKIGKLKKGATLPEKSFEFKRDGEDYFATIDEEKAGVDAEMLVRGLEGIPTMFPTMIRVMGGFSRFLRRAVVASPVYIARQMFRETLGATMTSGANLVPVVSAIKQIGKSVTLERRGITGGQVFTGLPEDMTRLLKEMQSGRPGWMKAFSKLEAFSAQADALTRKAQYDSYIEQGRSELEATYMSLESMNFTRRGLSPSLHMLSMMIPFFNAQIQGLDVLYRAFRGKMPLNDKLDIRNKLLTRGALLAGLSLLYAANMEDDETYANARPEEKYNNWFVRMPALDEMAGEKVTLRVPIPFELGYIFKALPEALYNTMATEKGGEDAVKAFKSIATMMVPGLSSYFLPQAIKPAIETAMGTSFLSGRSIESAYEQMVEPGQRVREGTSDVARIMGETLNISPVKLEYLIRGYTGSLGMALVQSLNFALPDAGPEAAYKRLSAMPVVGTLFQPEDSGGIIDAVYARMREVNQAKETYERLLESGQVEKATEFFNGRVQELTQVSMYGNLRQQLGELTAFERQVRASSMTPAEKRETLDNIRRIKIEIAKAVRSVS